MKQFHSTVVDQSLPIATIRCMYYNCDDDNDSLCLEYEGSNWNEDYDFSAMAKSQRGSGREREGWLIVTLIVFSYVFLNYGCLWNKPVDFLTSIRLKHHPDKIRLSTRNIFYFAYFIAEAISETLLNLVSAEQPI